MPLKQVTVVTKLKLRDLRPATRHIHRQTVERVLQFLKRRDCRLRVIDRSQLTRPLRTDLILAVGGDGTVLAASHLAGESPLIGINSAPETSIGFFCAASPGNFEKVLAAVFAGKRRPKKIPRLEVRVNGKRFPRPGLNEMLLASRLQGDTARYRIQVGGREEYQKSSGVWVATGAGSTAVIYSAGGKKLSPLSRSLQYRVREPFCFPRKHYRLLHGILKPGETVTLISEMRQGMIFVDGAKLHMKVPQGAKITVRGGIRPLNLFI